MVCPPTLPLPAPPSASARVLRSLAEHPDVERELVRRGVRLLPAADEGDEALENRLGTALMALWRDTRSEEAFETLYSATEAAVLAWIRSLVSRSGGGVDPTEVLQDTFVNVFRYPSGFRDSHVGSYRVWVRTIAGNIVRRARARRSRPSLSALPEGAAEPVDPRGRPDDQIVREEQESGLCTAWLIFLHHYGEAWKTLRPRDRLALQMVEVEGRSYTEAGELLRVGRSNMKMIVFRSRKRIARRMAESMRLAEGELRRAG